MSGILYYILSGVTVVGVLIGIYLMSNVKTAVKGNLLGSVCIVAAIIITLLRYEIVSESLLWIGMAIGVVIGLIWAYKVAMIQVPQLVALYNGFGGAASAIIAVMTLFRYDSLNLFARTTGVMALIIGIITFVGSLIATGKLHNLISQRPLILKGHSLLTSGMLVLILALIIAVVLFDLPYIGIILFSILISTLFGIAFTIRIGGADMPITISLLNSLSGVAGSVAGMAVDEPLLVAIGGIVGASGLLLTRVMCKSMNRSLMDILLGKTSAAHKDHVAGSKADASKESDELDESRDLEADSDPIQQNPMEILKTAKNVIIIPGYGMALAQAQYLVKQLTDKLEEGGAEVKFAIHPVAGRMPGHMNVLLSEVNIPYERLYEMDDINPEFESCDAAIVIGANDVINPAARDQEGTPIYGMPILNAYQAKHLFILNYDLKPGYAGVENPLYSKKSDVTLFLGDAKDTLKKILEGIA